MKLEKNLNDSIFDVNLEILEDSKIFKRFSKLESIRLAGLDDNKLKVELSKTIINKAGQFMNVMPPRKKSMRMKANFCYGNAHKKRSCGYEYVEGIIKHKGSGVEISHAWNVDLKTGEMVDFTIMGTDQFEYRGIHIPFDLRFHIALKIAPIWYCTLPYLKII